MKKPMGLWALLGWIGLALLPTSAQEEGATQGDLSWGWQEVEVKGNEARFRQYAVPAEAWHSPYLTLSAFDPDGFPRLDVSLRSWGEDVQRAEMALYGRKELSLVRLWGHRARFYPEPQSFATPPIASRVESGADAFWRWPQGYLLAYQFRHFRPEEPGIARLGGIRGREERHRGSLALPLGGGRLRLHYQQDDYVDGTGNLPLRSVQSLGAEYDWEGNRFHVAASYAAADLKLRGFPTSSVTVWRVRGLYLPGERWSLVGGYTLRSVDQPLTQNAYTTRSQSGQVEARYQPWREVRFRVGYERRNDRRLNTIQTFRYTPMWQVYFGEGEWQPAPGWRVTGRVEQRNLNGNPPTAIPLSPDARPLLYDQDLTLQLKASAMPIPRLLLYGQTLRRKRENTSRATRYQIRDWGGGGVWALSPRLSIDAHYRMVDWGSSSPVLAGALSENWLASLGATYQAGPLALAGSYGRYRSRDAMRVRDDQWHLSLRYILGRRASLEARYFDGDYDSPTLPALGYRARVWYVGYQTTF